MKIDSIKINGECSNENLLPDNKKVKGCGVISEAKTRITRKMLNGCKKCKK